MCLCAYICFFINNLSYSIMHIFSCRSPYVKPIDAESLEIAVFPSYQITIHAECNKFTYKYLTNISIISPW